MFIPLLHVHTFAIIGATVFIASVLEIAFDCEFVLLFRIHNDSILKEFGVDFNGTKFLCHRALLSARYICCVAAFMV